MAKKKAPIEVSVTGVAAYAWLDKPDTKFAAAGEDGKYKLTLVIDKEEASSLTAQVGEDTMNGEEWLQSLRDMHEKCGGTAKNSPVKDGDKPLGAADKPKEEFLGKWLVGFKSKFQPAFVDAKKAPLNAQAGFPDKPPVRIMSGDLVKAAYTRFDFDRGMSLRLSAVQLLDKRSTGGNAADAFGEEEGYDASSASPPFGGSDNAGGDAAAPASGNAGDF